MTASIASWVRRLAAPPALHAQGWGSRRVAALPLRLGCAALLAWIGYIHLHLWQEGYRQIPTDGPMFLLDAVAGFVFAAALLAWPRALTGLLAAGYTAATLGALLISLSVGLFGFRESTSASFVTMPSMAASSEGDASPVSSVSVICIRAGPASAACIRARRSRSEVRSEFIESILIELYCSVKMAA